MTQLKADNAGIHAFERNMRYTEAYRLTRNWADSRFKSYTIGRHTVGLCGWNVTSDIHPEVKFGQVGIAFDDIFAGSGFYLNIQIDSMGENKTQIKTYYRFKSWEEESKDLEKYIDENRSLADK